MTAEVRGAVVHHRAAARMPVRSGVTCEVVGRLVAEIFHAVAPLDQRHALGSETLQFDRADFGAVLVALAALLRLFVVVEFAFDAFVGAVEEIDGRPQEILEVGFEAGFAQARDECVEDVGDGRGDDTGFRQRSRVGFVLEGPIAVKLEFGKDVIGRGCSVWLVVIGLGAFDRHGGFPFVGSAALIAAFVATKGGGRTGPAPPSEATAAVAKRRMAGADYFGSRCKAPFRARRKIVGGRHCVAGPLAAGSPSQEGRERGPLRKKEA